MADIKQNLLNIKQSILSCEKSSGRTEGSVTLCAVSKFHPVEDMICAINEGQSVFGENRVQEAKEKYNYLTENGYDFTLHIIGSLQRNKVKDAVNIAHCIQSVDRIELMDEIEKQCAKIDKKIDVLFEVHTGEESKAGFLPGEETDKAVRLIAEGLYPHMTLRGFMTMAPATEDEKLIRNSFSTIRNLKEKYNQLYPSLNLTELSMGMSHDYKIAIEEGSTFVRVGTAIFGERNYNQ